MTEPIFLDYIVHSATNEGKAPGTVKLRLAAVRSFHLTMHGVARPHDEHASDTSCACRGKTAVWYQRKEETSHADDAHLAGPTPSIW